MKKKILGFLFLFVFLFSAFSYEISPLFKDVTSIPSDVKKVLDDDFADIDYKTYFDYYVSVCGAWDSISQLRSWFNEKDNLIDTGMNRLDKDDFSKMSYNDKLAFCNNLLKTVHDTFFKGGYIEKATLVADVYKGNNFNCVSSSLLMADFCLKYGIPVNVVFTKDHMFLQVTLDGEKTDVECTTKYGVNPGSKQEVLDEMGKLLGFRYVPGTDKSKCTVVGVKDGLLRVYTNRAFLSPKEKRYDVIAASLKLTYYEYIGTQNSLSRSNFFTSFNNLIVLLYDTGKYKEALWELNSFRYVIKDNYFDDLRNNVLFHCLNNNEFADYNQALSFFDEEFNRFELTAPVKTELNEFFFSYLNGEINRMLAQRKFEDTLDLFCKVSQKYTNKNSGVIIHNILVGVFNAYDNNKQFDFLDSHIPQLKMQLPNYLVQINEIETFHVKAKITHYVKSKQYDSALDVAKEYYDKLRKDSEFITLYQTSYNSYAIDRYNAGDYDLCLRICDEGYKLFPYDKVMSNNYSVFLENIIKIYINKADYQTAEVYVDYALERFPTGAFFLQCSSIMKRP